MCIRDRVGAESVSLTLWICFSITEHCLKLHQATQLLLETKFPSLWSQTRYFAYLGRGEKATKDGFLTSFLLLQTACPLWLGNPSRRVCVNYFNSPPAILKTAKMPKYGWQNWSFALFFFNSLFEMHFRILLICLLSYLETLKHIEESRHFDSKGLYDVRPHGHHF